MSGESTVRSTSSEPTDQTTPAGLASMVRTRLKDWATLDDRSLAAYRIAVGVLLLVDLLTRSFNVSTFYSNRGVLTNHYLLFTHQNQPFPSLLVGVADPIVMRWYFVGAALAYTAFLLGLRTRLSQVLSLIAFTGLNIRNPLIVYGGDGVLHIFLIWTLFLPLGRRWSVDARLQRESNHACSPRPEVPVAAVGIIVNLAMIYIFNAINKTGTTWSDGSALHYVFWQDSIARGPAIFLRLWAPTWSLRVLTWGALVVELAGGVLLLVPVAVTRCRRIALPLLVSLHLGIFITVNIAVFSWVMIVTYLLLVRGETWDALASLADERLRWPRVARALKRRAPPPTWQDRPALAWRFTREGIASLWALLCVAGLITDNPQVPASLRDRMPRVHNRFTGALLIHQGWGMFAPDAPTEEGWFVVEAKTVDGRLVDPFTLGPPRATLDPGFGAWLSQEAIGYSIRMRKGEYQAWMHVDLERFLWGSHLLPGRTEQDAVVSYEVYNLTRPSPPPGETQPPPTQKILLGSGRRP